MNASSISSGNWVAFAGGGSGGHSYPLLAIASELRRCDPKIQVYFVTTTKSVESKILDKAQVPYHLIPSGKLNSQSPLRKIITLLKLPLAFWKSIFILWRQRPLWVMSAGGYAGAPFLVAAAVLGIPCAIYEQNRKPGLANRYMSKFAQVVFVNFASTASFFPNKQVEVTGLPYRREISEARWTDSEWQKHLTSPKFRIFVFGGSQGASAINRLIPQAIPYLQRIRENLFIHHQTGQNEWQQIEQKYREEKFKECLVEPYVYDMKNAYREADLVICRAGASSLVELAAAAKPAVLIPLVSKDNHQVPNAEELASKGAAVMLLQNEASGEKLAKLILDFYDHRQKLRAVSEKMHKTLLENPESKILATMVKVSSTK